MKTSLFLILCITSFFCACSNRHDGTDRSETEPHQATSLPLNLKEGYAINIITGDSISSISNSAGVKIQTGQPVPASGKQIDPSRLQKPVIIPARKITQPLRSNSIHIDPHQLPKTDTSSNRKFQMNFGVGDTALVLKNSAGVVIPSGEKLSIAGAITPCKQPKPVKALPLRMKYDATRNIQYLDVEQGMNSPYVQCMIEDRFGNIWFGTYGGGASRYDGSSFMHYTTNEGLSDNIINCMHEDRSGNLWFGTLNGGIVKYDGSLFTRYSKAEGLTNDNIRCILEDRNGNLWFGTNGSGAIFFDGKTFTHFTTNEGLVHNIVRTMTEDKNGTIWFGCNDKGESDIGGISAYDGSSFRNFTTQNGLRGNQVVSLRAGADGKIWIGTEHYGLASFDGSHFTHYQFKDTLDRNVWTIMEDRDGGIWYGSEFGGVYHYSGKEIKNYSVAEGLNHKFILSILQDRHGNFWFGSFGGGVSRFDAKTFNHLTAGNGLQTERVWSIIESKKGEIIFGNDMGGFSVIGDSLITHVIPQGSKNNNAVTSIAEDTAGHLWLGTWEHGTYHYDGRDFALYSSEQGLSKSRTNSIIQDKSGNLWFGYEGGVTRFDGKHFTRFTDQDDLINNRITDLEEDKIGNIWITTLGGGVSKYDGSHFTHYTEKEGLNSNHILCALVDHQGNLWFGSDRAGLCRFDGKKFTYYTEQEGLSSNIIFSLAEDEKHNIWVSTENGISYLVFESEKDSNHPSSEQTMEDPAPRIIVLGSQDGLRALDFLTNSVLIDKQQRAWWGGGKSVVTLDLNKFAFTEEKPSVFLRNISINDKHEDFREIIKAPSSALQFDSVKPFENYPLNLTLPYNHNHLNFHFSAIDWSSPHKLQYRYRLLGLSDDWSDPGIETNADYRNLPPGDYTFSVQAIGVAQKWSDPLEYSFSIKPPWWLTWWAYLLYALIIFLLMLAIVRYRSRQLKSQNIILEKKVSVRTDQLRQSIEELKSAQAQLIQSEKMASLGELTAGIAHEIQNPLNFINNFSEVNSELIEEMKMKLDEARYEEAKAIAQAIDSNEQKINHHGKRADAIVKSMLQHSRKTSGIKEPTSVNALADEYLRLSYHGLRAKDKSFVATIKTDFDERIGMINIVPQDIGRVILNLITNAFYAVTEKKKLQPDSYQPTVEVRTKKLDGQIEIQIIDNGTGIPQDLVDKIFQPFFTTKPTGKGTGLGLSLSYDIVKAHGGHIEVLSEEGKGSTFIIRLPLS